MSARRPPVSPRLRTLARGAATALVLAGCREIRIEPGEHVDVASSTGASPASSADTSSAGGGSPTSTVASSSAGGTPGDGGGGAGGALPDPGPVPGCEELVWVGEPLVIPVGPWPTPRLATLDDGDVGLVVADRDSYPQALVSFVVDQPFVTWPPAVGAPTVVLLAGQRGYANGDFGNQDPRLSARGDGTYAATVPGQTGAVGTFGAAPSGLLFEGDLVLDPSGAGGAYRVLWTEEGHAIDRFESIAAGASPSPVGLVPGHGCSVPSSLVTAAGTFLLARGQGPECDAMDIFRVDGDGVAVVASLPASEETWQHELVPRPGGAWLVVVGSGGVTATALDGDGVPTGASWSGDPQGAGHGVHGVAPWRQGFALAAFVHVGDLDQHGVGIRVSDGVHETSTTPFDDEGQGATTRDLSVASSLDGRSLLVAHEVFEDLWVHRADCVTPASPP